MYFMKTTLVFGWIHLQTNGLTNRFIFISYSLHISYIYKLWNVLFKFHQKRDKIIQQCSKCVQSWPSYHGASYHIKSNSSGYVALIPFHSANTPYQERFPDSSQSWIFIFIFLVQDKRHLEIKKIISKKMPGGDAGSIAIIIIDFIIVVQVGSYIQENIICTIYCIIYIQIYVFWRLTY